ncbi:MAG: hypothetical protein J6K96_09920 [Treponema sp.]|nr:hypothetical protein [Treponema sp.]
METIRRFTRYGYMAMCSKNSDGFTPVHFTILKFGGKISSVLLEENSNENQIAAITNITEKTKAVLSFLPIAMDGKAEEKKKL